MAQLQVKETGVSQEEGRGGESTGSDVALAFFHLMYNKKHGMATKSPGSVPKVSKVLQSEDIRANAQIIAQRLAEMGDELEKRVELIAQLKEAFEKEFKMQSAFMMAYQGFSHVCIRFLSRTQGQMRTGWDQLYLLCYGHYIMGEELARQAGPESRERITTMANYVDDVMRDIRLDEWIAAQGGMARSGTRDIVGDRLVYIPDPDGSSVDK